MKKGDEVRVVQPIIQGKVKDTEYNKSTERLKHLVEYVDAEKETQTRWFDENELETV